MIFGSLLFTEIRSKLRIRSIKNRQCVQPETELKVLTAVKQSDINQTVAHISKELGGK